MNNKDEKKSRVLLSLNFFSLAEIIDRYKRRLLFCFL